MDHPLAGRSPQHPLLIEVIADKILGYLDRTEDLESSFDVCTVWRRLIPDHNIRIRPIRPPVLIKGDMSDDGVHGGYLAAVSKHPSFKATKFCFLDTQLNSSMAMVQQFLEEHGTEMEELQLWYNSALLLADLKELLKDKVQNLKTLVIRRIPVELEAENLFAVNPNTKEPSTTLALTKLVITTYWDSSEDGTHPPLSRLLLSILAASPQMEEFDIMDWGFHRNTYYIAERCVQALINTGRLAQIRSLKFAAATPDCLRLLNQHLVLNQLTSFVISRYPSPSDSDSSFLQTFLTQQSGTLKSLELAVFKYEVEPEPFQLTMPKMPNLVKLKLTNVVGMNGRTCPITLAHEHDILNYADIFPRLEVLGLEGPIHYFTPEATFPDPEFNADCCNSSLKVLQELPIGVDETLMSRIGRLFPNLSIIRIRILQGNESLLGSIWKHCPNITELFLTFGSDWSEDSDPFKSKWKSLDSIFSGIPEYECEHLRQVEGSELKCALSRLARLKLYSGRPSLRDLKYLKRLCIIYRSSNTFVIGQLPFRRTNFRNWNETPARAFGDGEGDRQGDKLTNIFGYSALANISSEFVFFQIDFGFIEMSSDCIETICEQTGLVEQNHSEDKRPKTDSNPYALRLIKPGLGLERFNPRQEEYDDGDLDFGIE